MTAPDMHVRLREARKRFDTPAIMARSLSIRVWAYTQRHGLTATDRESLVTLRDDLDTLAYWCASAGMS